MSKFYNGIKEQLKEIEMGNYFKPLRDVQYPKVFFDWLLQIYATLNAKGLFINLAHIVKDAHCDDQVQMTYMGLFVGSNV